MPLLHSSTSLTLNGQSSLSMRWIWMPQQCWDRHFGDLMLPSVRSVSMAQAQRRRRLSAWQAQIKVL